MKNIFNALQINFFGKNNAVTIKKANLFTTLYILFFTIVFVSVLIKENYEDYEKSLLEQQSILKDSNLQTKKFEEKEIQNKLKALMIKKTISIATLAFILFAIMLGFYKLFNALLQRDIDTFLDFFQKRAHSVEKLNPDSVYFKEFKVMVENANEMLCTINDQKTSLEELNLHLEDKVKEKTKDLEDILNIQKEFLRYTVHETNTPLSVILTSLELYEMNHKKDKHLSKVEAAAKNIFNIYDDLSYLVKKDQVEYHRVAIDVERYIKSRIDFFSEVALLSKLKFNFISEVKEIYIYFNETKLQRVVDNTLTNAIKYTYQNETVDVTLKQSGLYVDFSVGSHSQPIKDEDKIFDEYYREDTKSDKAIQGFGIGLRLVKNICEEEGVNIDVSSDNKRNIFTYQFKAMGD